jgi:hypothetical protein
MDCPPIKFQTLCFSFSLIIANKPKANIDFMQLPYCYIIFNKRTLSLQKSHIFITSLTIYHFKILCHVAVVSVAPHKFVYMLR